MTTIKNTQIVLKHYIKSIVLGNRTLTTNYSNQLQEYLESLLEYKDEILEYDSTYLVADLPNTYKDVITNINNLLLDSDNHVLYPDTSYTVVKSIKDIYYEYVEQVINDNIIVFYYGDISEYYTKQIKKNQRFKVYDEEDNYLFTGRLIEVADSYLYIETTLFNIESNKEKIAKCCVDLWWQPNETICLWTDLSCFEESNLNSWIHVKLRDSKNLYTLVWSLYYQSTIDEDELEVAKGTDNVQGGYAYLTISKKVFKAGYYTLRSREIKANNYSTNRLEFKWELKESNNFLKV